MVAMRPVCLRQTPVACDQVVLLDGGPRVPPMPCLHAYTRINTYAHVPNGSACPHAPVRETYAAMVESFAAVGDLDGALSAYDTLLRANGSPALLRKKYLGRLVGECGCWREGREGGREGRREVASGKRRLREKARGREAACGKGWGRRRLWQW